jgi:hypothetical protein
MKNVKAKWTLIGGLLIAIFASGCSYQWREADSGIGDEELMDLINKFGESSSTGGMSSFLTIAKNENAAVYFAEGWSDQEGTMGPPASVLAILDFSFMGQSGDLSPLDMDMARAIFVDLKNESGEHENALLIDFVLNGQTAHVTRVFVSQRGNGIVNGDEFEVEMSDSSGKRILVRSYDLVDGTDDLKGTIQLSLWDFDANNNEDFLGKISTLVGFGGQ